MRNGGGKQKGSDFERKVGVALSRWLTQGERADLFTRNEGSGSRHTVHSKRGNNMGVPGDLMAQRQHPQAFAFLDKIMVECKHYQKIFLEQFFYAPDQTWLTNVLITAFRQGEACGRECFVVVKENRRPILLFASQRVGRAICASAPIAPPHHLLFAGTIYMALFEDVLDLTDAEKFLRAL